MKPNILVLVIDSLRSDKCYGPDKSSQTPNLDNIIKNGIFFKKTISSIPATKRATASILTGLYPFKTGAQNDNFLKLDPSVNTYIKILKEKEYHPHATVPDVFSHTGMLSDFENNDKTYNTFIDRLQNKLGPQIISKLQSKEMEEPWLYYIHLLDLIRPVISHGKFNSGKYGKDQYDRVVSTIDFWLGQIIKNVDLKKTLIIITSDHGTYPSSININNKNYRLEPGILYEILWKIGFGLPPNLIPLWVKLNNLYKIFFRWKKDRLAKKLNLSSYQKRIFLNAIGHTRDIHDDCLLIPLIFFGYGINSSLLISQPVSQIDIFPTVLSILKIKNEDENVDGISLLPLIEGKKLNSIPSYIESLPTRENGWKKIIGIRTGNYKYGRNIKDSNKDIVLYDITVDPLEEHNLATNKPEIVERLENILNEIIKSPQKITKATSMSDEEIKKIENELKKLGYV